MLYIVAGRRLSTSLAPYLLAASMLASTTAMAADPAPTAADAAVAPAATSDEAETNNEVTVIARKRSENVQTVPVPVTVITPRTNVESFSFE